MAECGECTLCCRIMGVKSAPEDRTRLDKPAGVRCEHCDVGRGCRVYADRPGACSGWSCGWLETGGAPHLRPDRIHLLVSGRSAKLDAYIVNVDPRYPLAYMRPAAADMIRKMRAHSRHRNVVLIIGERRVMLTGDPKYAAMPAAALREELMGV